MNPAQSARAFEIYIAKREYKSLQKAHAVAKARLNRNMGPVCTSVSWSIFNTVRDRYIKSMAALRSALRAPKGEEDPDRLVDCQNSACRHPIPNGVEQCHICGAIQL